ncbi:hypothetical protein [Caudoviricetes sp.]|nr:hypothetical protein [Caudoviricetes sp.]
MTVQELVSRLRFVTENSGLQRAHGAIKGLGKAYDALQKKIFGGGRDEKGRFLKKNKLFGDASFGGIKSFAAGYLGFKGLGLAKKSLIDFNADVEETKLQIAGMFALTKKTNLNDELGNANELFKNLQARAAKLPGTTAEYAAFAAQITRSVTDAGLGMKDLEDLTVNSVVAAKAFGEQADVAARDIDQLLRGRYNTTDPFSSKLLGNMMVGNIKLSSEEGRKLVRRMSESERAELLKTALKRKQINQLAEAQGKTLRGKWSTLVDYTQQTLGKIGAPLFEKMKVAIDQAVQWLEANAGMIETWAKDAGESIGAAFNDVFVWVRENWDDIVIVLKGVGFAIAIIAGAVGLLVRGLKAFGRFLGTAAAMIYSVFLKVQDTLESIFEDVWSFAKAAGVVFTKTGEVILGVFKIVGDTVRGIVEWVSSKINWVVEKAQWIADKFKFGGDAINFEALNNQMITREMSAGNANGTTAPLTNLVIHNQIQANGLNQDQAKALFDQRMIATYRDAAAVLGGTK